MCHEEIAPKTLICNCFISERKQGYKKAIEPNVSNPEGFNPYPPSVIYNG